MTIQQKIWSIPFITILIFSIGMAVVYKSASHTYDLLQRTGVVHYPFLHQVQVLSDNLGVIQNSFLDALDSSSELGINRARLTANDFRKTAVAIAAIDGKSEVSQKIMLQFNSYFAAAESAATIIMGLKKGNGVADMEHMVIAMNHLTNTLQREHLEATKLFENSLDESKSNVQQMLWASLISVFFVLLGLAITSYQLITSILSSLNSLRAGAQKITQGDFDVRIPARGNDELTLVIQSFNSMGEELQSATTKRILYENQLKALNLELEGRVLARTAELGVALEEAKKANAAVSYMADHDSLTGLLSRRRFQEEYERWVKYAARHERSMALMFIDLDKFKDINDTYGHLGGDVYLQGVADLLKKTLRSTDYVGRWGGDEFAALLPEATSAAACEVAVKLVDIFNSTPITVGGRTLYASASIGIAVLPEHTQDIGDLTAFADAAMYKAKDAGRGCFRLYSASEHEVQHLGEHARWAGRIRRALESDQFVLFYQPILDLKSGEVTDYEALLRMEDHGGKFISPGLFLASAERFDLSVAIDRMVIRKVVNKISLLSLDNMRPHISLNLSTQFLDDSGMVDYIRNLIAEFEIPPGSLHIEISEAIILQNMSRVCNLSADIKKLGCRLILDDIGVGFSSFHYLAPLSIQSIKIRGDLIQNLHVANNYDYIAALCKTCHELDIQVVAKSVENLTLLDSLRKLGVDYAQGFAVGSPLETLCIHDEEE